MLAYPQRAAAAGEGESARLNSLLVYDMKALVVVGLIFVSMVLYAAYVEVLTAQDRAAAVADPDATYATFVAHATHADRHHTPHQSKLSAFQLAAQMESSVETTIGTLGLVVLELFRCVWPTATYRQELRVSRLRTSCCLLCQLLCQE